MSEQPIPYTASPPAESKHEHVAPSADPAAAYGHIVRIQKAMQTTLVVIGRLQALLNHLAATSGELQRDEPMCPSFPETLVIFEDELAQIGEVRARAVSRMKLATEACPRITKEQPSSNGVAS